MARLSLPEECVLVRTAEGTRRMRSHGAGITPKLRAVLFLIDGVQPARKILERAGDLRPLLESQIAELMKLALVEVTGAEPPTAMAEMPDSQLAGTASHAAAASGAEIPPLVGAKMQLLTQLERLDGRTIRQYSAALVEARSWRDLAMRSKDLSRTLHEVAGADAAAVFWTRAKEILVMWRGKEVSLARR